MRIGLYDYDWSPCITSMQPAVYHVVDKVWGVRIVVVGNEAIATYRVHRLCTAYDWRLMMVCSARYRTGWKTEAKVQGITCEESRRENGWWWRWTRGSTQWWNAKTTRKMNWAAEATSDGRWGGWVWHRRMEEKKNTRVQGRPSTEQEKQTGE